MNNISVLLISATLFLFGNNVNAAQNPNVTKISDNVYSMFLSHYQSLVVIGEEGVLITDPANSNRAKELKTEVAKLTSLPINKIVLTHEHYDHVGGTEVFPQAEIYAHHATEPVFRIDVTGQAPSKVDNYVGDRTRLNIGKTSVDLLHFGASDGVGMLAIHLPKEQVVLSADLYETGEITNKMWLADSNYLGSRTLLNELVKLKPKYAITTHSAEIDPKELKLAADFYNDLYAVVSPELEVAMKQGFGAIVQTLNTLPKEVKLPKYKKMRNYDHLPAHVERMILSIFHGG